MKLVAFVLGMTVFGWALVAAAESRQPGVEREVRMIVIEREVEAAVELDDATSFTDSLIDWDEVDRQDDCLWRFMQDHNLELTFDMVWAASEVTDALGGACFVIGEDDE
jgi:hypothetical protein